MTDRIAAAAVLLVFLSGCSPRPVYRHDDPDDQAFRKKLAYSRNLFSQPIDILEADSVFVFAQGGSRTADSAGRGDVLSRVSPRRQGDYAVQIASFSNRENAGNARSAAQRQYPDLSVSVVQHQGYWRVVIGFYDNREAAQQVLQRLRSSGRHDAWIFRP